MFYYGQVPFEGDEMYSNNANAHFSAAVMSGVLLPLCAFAADDQASGRSAATNSGLSVVEEIVVTANRREERLQDVPITVNAISGEKLTELGITNPEDLARVNPSLLSQNSGAFPQGTNFAIRGVGTLSFQQTIESSVAVVLDDVSFIRPMMGVVNFADLAQVEVLNGPQGMLFGKNASAGLVNIRTNNPVLDQTTFRAFSEYSRLNTSDDTTMVRLQGVGTVPLSSDAAARVNLYYQSNEPLFENLTKPKFGGGLRQIGGTAKALWQPTDKMKVLFAGDYMDSSGQGTGVAGFRYVSPGSFNGPILASVGIEPGKENTEIATNSQSFADLKVGGGSVKLDYTLDSGYTLTNILAARTFKLDQAFDGDYGPLNLFDFFGGPSKQKQVSNELRFASPVGERWDYQVGLYLLEGKISQAALVEANLGAPPPPGFTWLFGNDVYQQQKLGSYAAFGQGTYRITDALRAVVGGRVTYDTVDMEFYSLAHGGALHLVDVSPRVSDKLNETNFSWRGTLQYDLTDHSMVYGSMARGYKGPGYSQFSLTAVSPEIPTHYEMGWKTEFFDRKLLFNIAAYHTRFKDFQAQSMETQTFTIITSNAGQVTTRGLDVQLTARPLEALSISAGATYTDAQFDSFKSDLCYAGQLSCVNGISDSSGNRLPNAPKWKGLFDVSYEHSLNEGIKGTVGLGMMWQSKMNLLSNDDPQGIQSAYTTVDVRLGLADKNGRWSLQAFCRNCTDERYSNVIQPHVLVPTDYIQSFSYGAFRSYGLAIDVNF